jgi:hypothetical protein
MKSVAVLAFTAAFLGSVFLSVGTLKTARSDDFASTSESTAGATGTPTSAMPGGVDLESEITNFLNEVRDPAFDSQHCVALLDRTTSRLSVATPQDFAPTAALQAQYRQSGVRYVHDLFNAKLALRARLSELANSHALTPQCVSSSRELFRVARYLEDLLGEYALNLPRYNAAKKVIPFTGGEPYQLTNSKFGGLKFRSGDLVMTRGTAFTSAAIARLGNNDASFSHLAMIYVDPKTGRWQPMEALIETGSYVANAPAWLNDGKVRAMVFRHRDAQLAARAAQMIHDEITTYQARHGGENIPYDSNLDVRDSSKLFCSELISHAFDLATGGAHTVPAYPSMLTPKNPYFLKRLGVQVTQTFLPMDIEVDPQFELVSEWRDYSQMSMIHMHDAVIGTVFSWIDNGKYVFHDGAYTTVKSDLAYNLRRWPLFSTLLKDTVPSSLSADQIALVQSLDRTSDLLYTQLAAANEAQAKKTGQWLTIGQMDDVLERYRRDDWAKNGPLRQNFSP